MHSQEIERRLRLPAPDEPVALPALILPNAPFGVPSGIRVHTGRTGRTFPTASPRLVFAVLLLLAALIGALLTGALRLDLLKGPLQAVDLVSRGIALRHPPGWLRLTPDDGGLPSGAFTALILSNTGVAGCAPSELPANGPMGQARPTDDPPPSADPAATYVPNYGLGIEDRIFGCVIHRQLAPGEIRIVVSFGFPQEIGVGQVEPFDWTDWFGADAIPGGTAGYVPRAADGWTDAIDGMPAKLLVERDPSGIGADEVRTWGVFAPTRTDDVWYVRASLRGPDLEVLRAEADAVARSLTFAQRPPPLDAARLDAALAREIDRLDRETRASENSRIFGCFPRTAGSQVVRLEEGPRGPLHEPVDVTCTTTVETTPLFLWRATLIVSWPAAEGRSAGEWGWALLFDALDGAMRSRLGDFPGPPFPGENGPLPAPLDGPLEVPLGAVVRLLPPGIDQAREPIQGLYQQPHPIIRVESIVTDVPPGRRFVVLDGPVTHRGIDWYLVEGAFGTMYPPQFQWLPASDGERPLIEVVEPACPTQPTVADLIRIVPAERVACYGASDLVLEPVVLGEIAPEMGSGGIGGTPAWLAPDPVLRLFGAEGPDGLDQGLPVAVPPGVDPVPMGTPLVLHGHFADSASETCRRDAIPYEGVVAETPAIQALRCRELFVIRSFELGGQG
jgi:hypothetical protein